MGLVGEEGTHNISELKLKKVQVSQLIMTRSVAKTCVIRLKICYSNPASFACKIDVFV